jgi:hypothetical protein
LRLSGEKDEEEVEEEREAAVAVRPPSIQFSGSCCERVT